MSDDADPSKDARLRAQESWGRYRTSALILIAALTIAGVAWVLCGRVNATTNAPPATGTPGATGKQAPLAQPDGEGTDTPAAGAGSGATTGTIDSVSAEGLTMIMSDGSIVSVTVNGATAIIKSAAEKLSDLATGDTVLVIGETDSSGDISAFLINARSTGPAGPDSATGVPDGSGPVGVAFAAGTVESRSSESLVVKLADGSTVTVITDGTTIVTRSTSATISDLATGDTINVVGGSDSNGSIVASVITEGFAGLAETGASRGSS